MKFDDAIKKFKMLWTFPSMKEYITYLDKLFITITFRESCIVLIIFSKLTFFLDLRIVAYDTFLFFRCQALPYYAVV